MADMADTVVNAHAPLAERMRPKALDEVVAAHEQRLAQLDQSGRGGAPDRWTLLLLRRLLAFHARDRISARLALEHAFFHGAHRCPVCGAEFELREARAQARRSVQPPGHPPPGV